MNGQINKRPNKTFHNVLKVMYKVNKINRNIFKNEVVSRLYTK